MAYRKSEKPRGTRRNEQFKYSFLFIPHRAIRQLTIGQTLAYLLRGQPPSRGPACYQWGTRTRKMDEDAESLRALQRISDPTLGTYGEQWKRLNRMDKLQKGQEVVIKATRSFFGTVVSSRDDGAEGTIYKVLVPERRMYFRRADLEPWPEPNALPQRGSKEWLSEMAQLNELTKQCLAKPRDTELFRQWTQSAEKLGFIVPIKQSNPTLIAALI